MKIQLTNGALRYLRSLIESVGWAKSTELIYRGGQLLCDVFPEQKDAPEEVSENLPNGLVATRFKDPKAAELWIKSPAPEFEISDKLFETCQTAIKHFSTEARVSPSKVSFELLKVFKLSPD